MRTVIILGLIGLASSVSISVQDQTPPKASCVPGTATTPGNMDCSCADKSYLECQEPVPDVSVHTNNLEECILNCDLFSSFGQCDWFVFYNSGPDENCRMFGAKVRESMDTYLGTCNVVGQPTRYDGDTCMTDSPLVCEAPAQPLFCSGAPPCKVCDDTDDCNVNYHEAECAMTTAATQATDIADSSYSGCSAACIASSIADEVTYFTWDRSAKVCNCFNGGFRDCQLQVVKQGFTLADINACKIGKVSGDCASDSDCAGNLLCDLTGVPVCKEGCRQHDDCQNDEYCTCPSCATSGNVGECKTGCRDLADKCPMPGGGFGNCNIDHICTTAGTPKLNSIGLKTTSCTGCNSRVADPEGAVLDITLLNSPEISCITNVLDNPDQDYEDGAETNFTDDLLGGCKLIDSYGASMVTVSWEGAGVWTPEAVSFRWAPGSLAYSCNNVKSATVSAGSSITLICNISL